METHYRQNSTRENFGKMIIKIMDIARGRIFTKENLGKNGYKN